MSWLFENDDDRRYYERYEQDEPRPTINETWHCTKCAWEGNPECSIEYTSVPYGETWVEFESDSAIYCPKCHSDEFLNEGELPEVDDE